MPERINLDEMGGPSRRPIDASWSKQKKLTIGIASGTLTIGVVVFGVAMALRNSPPALPTTAAQAVELIESGRVERLDPERQRAFYLEAGRLIRDLPQEERAALRDNEALREARGEIGTAFLDDIARRAARGEDLSEIMPWGRRQRGNGEGDGRPGGPPGDTPNREDRADGREGERPSRAQRNADRLNRLEQAFQEADAQSVALRGEFFKRMRDMREQRQRESGGG